MLFRFDPFEPFERLERRPAVLAMDAVRNDDTVFIYFDAPGMSPDDIDLTVEESSVTVHCTRRWVDTDQQTLTSERPQGTFRRQIQLGDSLDTAKLSARLAQGVLTLEIPVKEGTKPRRITIDSDGGERELLAGSEG